MRIRNSAAPVCAARSTGLLVEQVGDETVVYDLESKEAHCLKALAAFVFAQADGQRSVSEIAELANAQLAERVSEQDVQEAVDQLELVALLERPLVVLHDPESDGVNGNGNGVSRREMMRRVGFAGAAAAVATSMITSIVPPTAAATGSKTPPGCTGCTKNSDCSNLAGTPGAGHCCQSVSGKSCSQGCCTGDNNSCHVTSSTGTCSISGATCSSTQACASGSGVCVYPCSTCLVNCPNNCPPGSTLCCTTSSTGTC